jgi:chromosome segregation ATPase
MVGDIKGGLAQGQVQQVGGRIQAVEGSVTTLDGSVSNLETRIAALSAAMQDYQQAREKVDAGLAEGLATLAQTLEQIKVNQMLLSRRLNQTREDARMFNEKFQGTLEQLRKESLKVKPEPKEQTPPPQDDESDE